jgi:hypothetical protein
LESSILPWMLSFAGGENTLALWVNGMDPGRLCRLWDEVWLPRTCPLRSSSKWWRYSCCCFSLSRWLSSSRSSFL